MSLRSPAVLENLLAEAQQILFVVGRADSALSSGEPERIEFVKCVRDLYTAADELVFWLDAEWENGVHSQNGHA